MTPLHRKGMVISSRQHEELDKYVDLTFTFASQDNNDFVITSLLDERSLSDPADSNSGADEIAAPASVFILRDLTSAQDTRSLLGALPTDWMHQTLKLLGCRPLRHICLPGSHDAGMSTLTHSTFLSFEENTLTQWVDIAGQLRAGIRYFDLRPVISRGEFVSGHYSKIAGNWVGGNGQSLSSIIDQINQFLSSNKELVILDLSHMYNTDEDWRGLNHEEYARLFAELRRIEHRYTNTSSGDLSALPLSAFISESASVLIVVTDPTPIPIPADSGIFAASALPIFNSFANTPLAPVMRDDQLEKLASKRKSRDDPIFLLSWTLKTPLDIRDLAKQAHDMLFDVGDAGLWSSIFREKDSGMYPNVVMVDGIGNGGADDQSAGGRVLAELSMAINSVVLDGVECPSS